MFFFNLYLLIIINFVPFKVILRYNTILASTSETHCFLSYLLYFKRKSLFNPLALASNLRSSLHLFRWRPMLLSPTDDLSRAIRSILSPILLICSFHSFLFSTQSSTLQMFLMFSILSLSRSVFPAIIRRAPSFMLFSKSF